MKRQIALILVAALLLIALSGCTKNTTLNPDKPVTLTMWHVYGEQADSPMNRLVEEFNRTVGREKGVIINVTLMSSTAQIGQKLLDAQAETPGVPAMPDLFFCHNNNAQELGAENLLDWNTLFTQEELSAYVPEFLDDGMVDSSLCVFPCPSPPSCCSLPVPGLIVLPRIPVCAMRISLPGRDSSMWRPNTTTGPAASPSALWTT